VNVGPSLSKRHRPGGIPQDSFPAFVPGNTQKASSNLSVSDCPSLLTPPYNGTRTTLSGSSIQLLPLQPTRFSSRSCLLMDDSAMARRGSQSELAHSAGLRSPDPQGGTRGLASANQRGHSRLPPVMLVVVNGQRRPA